MMLKSVSNLNSKKTPVAVAVPITNEHENTEEVYKDAGDGENAAPFSCKNENDSFIQYFETAYSSKKSLFTTKVSSSSLTDNYQNSISLIQNLRSPTEVSDENLDDTFQRFEELMDFFLKVPKTSTATLVGLERTIPMVFKSYIILPGFYPKLLEKIKKYDADIQNNKNEIKNAEKNKKSLIVTLKAIEAQSRIAWSTADKKAEIQKKQAEIENLENDNSSLDRKKVLIVNYRESLKSIELASGAFPDHIRDLHWYAEVVLSVVKNITDKDKEEIIQAATEKNIEKILDYVSFNSERGKKLNMNPGMIFGMIKRMPSLTCDQLTTCQRNLNKARKEYVELQPNGNHRAKFDEMLQYIEQQLESSAPSAPPLLLNQMDAEQNSSIENVIFSARLDVEEEEFYDAEAAEAVIDRARFGENINLGKLLVDQWKNENLLKVKTLQQMGEAAAKEKINGLGI